MLENKIDLILSIENAKNEIDSYIKTINDGILSYNVVKNIKEMNNIAIESKIIDLNYLQHGNIVINNCLSNLGCENRYDLSIKENLSFEENISDINLSLEGVGGDIWLAVKKVFEKVISLIAKFYSDIRKFFGVIKANVEETKKKLDGLQSLNDFKLDNDSMDKIIKFMKNNLKTFSALGYDILNKTDLDNYNKALIGNKWLYEQVTLVTEGDKNGNKHDITFTSGTNIIKAKYKTIFSNINTVINEKYKDNVEAHYMAIIKSDSCLVMSILNKDKIISVDENILAIDNKALDTNTVKSLSNLNKTKIYDILDAVETLYEEENTCSDLNNKFLKKLEEANKKLIENNTGNESLFTSNINKIAKISTSIGESLYKHVKIYQTLSENLVNIYEKSAKNAK